jgi:4-aminobutyrate aminotransferase-like enzyme
VGQVRGRGLMRGIELVWPGTREPDADTAGRV